MSTGRLDKMSSAVGPNFGLVVDERGRPIGAREIERDGDEVEISDHEKLFEGRSFANRLPTRGEADALGRACRVLAGGGQ